MMRRLAFPAGIAALILALAPWGGSAQENRGLSVLEAASARYHAAKAVCANFTQTLSVPLLGQENRGNGRLCQEQPDLFAMRFDDPAGYYKSSDPKTVIRLPVADAPGGFDLYREFLEDPAEKYEISYEGTEKVDGRETDRIRLVPRTPASYQTAVLWIGVGDHLLRRVKLEEENESVRTVTLSEVTFDPRIPEGWFTFTPPSGVQIISR